MAQRPGKPSAIELNDARGDAHVINGLLTAKLEEVHVDASGWTTIYRHRETNELR